MKWFAIIALMAIVALILSLGSSIAAFIDIPSLILVIGFCLVSILARHGIKGFSLLFDEDKNETVVYTLAYSALIGGLLAFPLAAVSVLSVAKDMSSIGPSMAVSMLSPFYGLLIYACCFVVSPKMKLDTVAAIMMLPLSLISIMTFALITWLIKLG